MECSKISIGKNFTMIRKAPLSLSCHVMTLYKLDRVTWWHCHFTTSHWLDVILTHLALPHSLVEELFCWGWQPNGRSFSCCGRQHRYIQCPLGHSTSSILQSFLIFTCQNLRSSLVNLHFITFCVTEADIKTW